MKWLLSLLISIITLFTISHTVYAQSPATYNADYDFSFSPNAQGDLDVVLIVHLKNLRSDLYINEFSLTFPKNFISGSITARDGDSELEFVRQDIATGTKVTFKFDEPVAQKTEHFITLNYKLADLFTESGYVTEAILPLIQPDANSKVNVELMLPASFDKIISISKPIPSQIEGTRITWQDVKVRTIYAVFGESQVYDVGLTYNLENSTVFAKPQIIALPPDTLYQKVIIDHISEEPDKANTDADGNYLAEYSLGPKEKKTIKVHAKIEVFAKPQESMRNVIKQNFELQKSYLLTEHDIWKIDSITQIPKLKTINDVKGIYNFIVSELSYSFDRVEKGNKRLGAQTALDRPSLAVCTEFTDLFVALAREKGIYAREVQGYGYSPKQNIRPLSLVTDVLHAWPEFYEPAQNIWVQVDPTWEDTSGIDYFTGFDVNHIVFAIHGKSPTLPLPAGFYKTGPTKDIEVSVSSDKGIEKPRISVNAEVPDGINAASYQKAIVYVKNNGNTTLHDLQLSIESKYITTKEGGIKVGYIAPFELKAIEISLKANINSPDKDIITISHNGTKVFTKAVAIKSSKVNTSTIVTIVAAGFILLLLTSLVVKSRH